LVAVPDPCVPAFRLEYRNGVFGIGNFVNRLVKKDLKIWGKTLNDNYLRVQNSVQWLDDEHPTWMRNKCTRKSLLIKPTQEVVRVWLIQFRDATKNEWNSLFLVKKSEIPEAGYGLFAARPYSVGNILGVFYGKVTRKDADESVAGTKNRPYAMEVTWPPSSQKKAEKKKQVEQVRYIVDPEIGPTSRLADSRPCYFALHMANDPAGPPNEKKTRTMITRGASTANFIVDESLVAVATKNIAYGDELFLTYAGNA
jgi:hypothetical protein